jgi:hypothetical protein
MVGSWTLKVVVAMKEGKRAKAGEQMLILFASFRTLSLFHRNYHLQSPTTHHPPRCPP